MKKLLSEYGVSGRLNKTIGGSFCLIDYSLAQGHMNFQACMGKYL